MGWWCELKNGILESRDMRIKLGFVYSNEKAICIKAVENIARSGVLIDSLACILGLVWRRDAHMGLKLG